MSSIKSVGGSKISWYFMKSLGNDIPFSLINSRKSLSLLSINYGSPIKYPTTKMSMVPNSLQFLCQQVPQGAFF